MNRRAQFSLLYEVVGLMVFGIVTLIWFGGIESIIGGLTDDNAINSFNQLTGAIRDQCLAQSNPQSEIPQTLLTGLDLTSFGSTFIITQLTIPEEFRSDPETMGFIQPQMRKCIGGNCMCLLELKELEGNWQMCTTSDFDSSNIIFGGMFGPPGCPFWYYAPPTALEQAITSITDMLEIDAFSIFWALLFTEDTDEHYQYPTPELWGGCSGASKDNLKISNFERSDIRVDCSVVAKPLKNYFGPPPPALPTAESVTLSNFRSEADGAFLSSTQVIDYSNGLIDEVLVNSISNKVFSVLTDNFKNSLSPIVEPSYSGIIINSVKGNLSVGEQLNTNLNSGFNSIISSIVNYISVKRDDVADLSVSDRNTCVYNMIESLDDSLDDVYYNQDISVTGDDAHISLFEDIKASIDFSVTDLLENLDSIDVTFNVRGDRELSCTLASDVITCGDLSCNVEGDLVYCDEGIECSIVDGLVCYNTAIPEMTVEVGDCEVSHDITAVSFEPITFSIQPSCFSENTRVMFYEKHKTNDYSISVKTSDSLTDFIDSQIFYPGDIWRPHTSEWLVDVEFKESIINSEIVDYGLNALTINAITGTLNNFPCPDVSCTNTSDSFICSGSDYSLDCTRDEFGLFSCEDIQCVGGDLVVKCDDGLTCEYNDEGVPECNKCFSAKTYGESVRQKLSDIDFSDLTSNAYNNFTSYYYGVNAFFDTLLDQNVFQKTYADCLEGYTNCETIAGVACTAGTAGCQRVICEEVTDVDKEITNSINNITNHLLNNLSNTFSSTIDAVSGLSELDLSFTPATDYSTIYDFTSASSTFSEGIAQEQLPYLKQELIDCLSEKVLIDGIQVDDNLILEAINSTEGLLEIAYSDLLNGHFLANNLFLNDSFNTINDNNNLASVIPAGFDFNTEFAEEISDSSSEVSQQLVNYYYTDIGKGLSNINSYIKTPMDTVFASAYPGGVTPMVDCWPGWDKNGTATYFKASPHVNDVLSWRRYTSVSRLQPMISAFGVDALGNLIDMGISSLGNRWIRGSRSTNYAAYTDERRGMDDTFGTNVGISNTQMRSPPASTVNAFTNFETRMNTWFASHGFFVFGANTEGLEISNLSVDYSSITGMGAMSVFMGLTPLPSAGKKLTVEGIKNFFKKVFKKKFAKILLISIARLGAGIAINIWRNSIINQFNDEVVQYFDGGIRTFDPDKINVRACMRMDELGCDVTDAVWVNESFYCQTDVYVRRVVNPNTWMNYLKGNDKCANAVTEDKVCLKQINATTGQCLRNTFTSCYKLSCAVPSSTNIKDRYHVFQYWVGASGDPSGLFGANYGGIQGLKIYRAEHSGHAWDGEIMLEVIGGNESLKLPGSIV